MVLRCVRESVLLYCHLLRNKEPVSFVFKNLGVMTCQDNFLCMRFFCSCIAKLETNATILALFHTRFWMEDSADFGPETTTHGIWVFPRFQLTEKKSRAEAAAEQKAAVERKMSRGGSAGRLLQTWKTLSPSMLLQHEPGSRQQNVAKEPSASALPLCAGSFHRTKKAGQKEASTPAQTSTALPASEESKRVLQELREVSAWNEADCTRLVYQQQVEQARAEMAAWEGWSAGEDQHPPQLLSGIDPAVNHPLSQGASSAVNGLGAGRAPRSMAKAGLPPWEESLAQPRREKGKAVGSRGLAGPSLLLARACCRALDRGPLGNSPMHPAALLTASPLWQLLARESMHAPHPSAQPRGQQVGRRWRKNVDPLPGSKMGTATKLALHADLLSLQAAQVLQKLEPRLHQQEAFASTAERNRQKLELKRQLPCARCSHHSGGKVQAMVVTAVELSARGWEAVQISTCEWKIIESKTRRMAWVEKDLEDHLDSTPLLCAAASTSRLGCPEPHPCLQEWGIHHFSASCSSMSPLSLLRTLTNV
ncbi:uncharacterized protein LOC116238932 isoform X2 [Phasianus colchicus]|nr:uncharacterized protein LOC116238932 isoform X2 [Phasianus colchicus]